MIVMVLCMIILLLIVSLLFSYDSFTHDQGCMKPLLAGGAWWGAGTLYSGEEDDRVSVYPNQALLRF